MISAKQAIDFARDNFPQAPEKLAKHLNVEIRESSMKGCDGWCLTTGQRTIIRINRDLSATRKRFTLAHELGHFILGVPTVVGESFEEMLASDSAEERRVNQLASELLIPTDVVKASVPDVPVVAAALKKLAKKANVSVLAAAIRVCNLASEIGLINASVIQFDNDQIRWQWSTTLGMTNEAALGLLTESRKIAPRAYRRQHSQDDVVVASTIENRHFGSATLFVQLLPSVLGMNISHHERRKELEQILFANTVKLQPQMAGMMSAHKQRISDMTEQQAIADFWDRHRVKLQNTTINTEEGRAYVSLRISEWF